MRLHRTPVWNPELEKGVLVKGFDVSAVSLGLFCPNTDAYEVCRTLSGLAGDSVAVKWCGIVRHLLCGHHSNDDESQSLERLLCARHQGKALSVLPLTPPSTALS